MNALAPWSGCRRTAARRADASASPGAGPACGDAHRRVADVSRARRDARRKVSVAPQRLEGGEAGGVARGVEVVDELARLINSQLALN